MSPETTGKKRYRTPRRAPSPPQSGLDERDAAHEELRQNLDDLSRMQQVSTRLMQAGNIADLLRDILAAAIDITAADVGSIQLLENKALRIAVQHGLSGPLHAFFDRVEAGQAACGTADLGMPHVDGFQLIERVRAHQNPLVSQEGGPVPS